MLFRFAFGKPLAAEGPKGEIWKEKKDKIRGTSYDMKKILFLTILFAFSKASYGDIIPDHSHSIHKCVKIVNAQDFPGISLIAVIRHPGSEILNAQLLDPSACIEKGYKFNILRLFAVKSSYIADKKLDSINWLKDKNCLHANIYIESDGGYADNATPVSSIDEFYKIEGITDTSIILYKCKEVIKFNNGRPVSINTYAYKAGMTALDQQNSTPDDPFATDNYFASTAIDFLKALLLTVLIETLVPFLFFKTKFRSLPIKNKLLLFTGFLASFATLPYVWFVLPVFIQPTFTYVLVSELSVTLIESLIICSLLKVGYNRSMLISVACNLASFLAGLLIAHL